MPRAEARGASLHRFYFPDKEVKRLKTSNYVDLTNILLSGYLYLYNKHNLKAIIGIEQYLLCRPDEIDNIMLIDKDFCDNCRFDGAELMHREIEHLT
jgi:hypothetical protein